MIHILQPFELQLLCTGSGNPQEKNMYLQYLNEAVAVVHRSGMIIYYSVLPLVTMMAFVTEIFEPAFSFTNASSSETFGVTKKVFKIYECNPEHVRHP